MYMPIQRFPFLAMTGCLAAILASAAGAQELNKLTPTETSAGYDLLFNGTDLSNWHAYRAEAVTDAWTVKTNAPLGARIEAGNGNKQPILTNKKYMNFDLKMDVQTTVDGNSGIFTRYEENATSSANSRTGPEFQVCGPSNSDCAGATKHFGSCYDMFGVKTAVRNTWYNPPGSWNQIRIVAFDSNYVHYGNGKKLLEYKIGTQEFLTAYNASKYVSDGNNGRYYHVHPGGFLLQHHGEIGLSFRNAKAKELDMHPFKREFTDGKWPDELPQDFVFGATTGLAEPTRGAVDPEISVAFGGAGATLVKVASFHSAFSVTGIDGRAVPFRKTAEGVYSIIRGQSAPGIVIVRLRAGGNLLSKIVGLQ
jgi:hypothetical protein